MQFKFYNVLEMTLIFLLNLLQYNPEKKSTAISMSKKYASEIFLRNEPKNSKKLSNSENV